MTDKEMLRWCRSQFAEICRIADMKGGIKHKGRPISPIRAVKIHACAVYYAVAEHIDPSVRRRLPDA